MKYLADIPILMSSLYASYTDLKRMEIDNWLCGLIAVYAILVNLSNPAVLVKNIIWAVCFFAVFLAIYVLFDDSIGGGDIKMLSALAVYYGSNILLLTFIANVAALIYCLVAGLLKRKDEKRSIKFGPFIFLAVVIMTLGKP